VRRVGWEISWVLDRGGQSRGPQWRSTGKESFLGRRIGEVSPGSGEVKVSQCVRERGTEEGPVVKPVGVRSPIADPWKSGRPVKELRWRCSQVTREGFAEVSSAKKEGVARASRLVQVEFLTLDKVTFSSKSEYDQFCHSGEVRSILR